MNKIQKKMVVTAVSAALFAGLALPLTGCGTQVQADSTGTGYSATDTQAGENEDILETAAKQMLRTDITSSENGKEETVYVLTDADGNTGQVIVSAHVKNGDRTNELRDRTDLTDIENTKGDEEYTKNADGSITWDAHGNDIFYRGESDAPLPLEVKLTYKLDGKEVTADELAGASGHLTLEFRYENHSAKTINLDGEKTEIVRPAVVVSGLLLDEAHAQNIQVTNGRVLNDGDRCAVVGLALPGLAENLTCSGEIDKKVTDLPEIAAQIETMIPESVCIEADVTDFSLMGTITVASYDVSGLLTSDSDSLEKKAEDLKKDAGDLTDGMTALKDGAGELSDYLEDLHSGSKELSNGVSRLSDGAQTLKGGAQNLSDGTLTLTDGADSVADGAVQVDAGVARLQEGTAALNAGVISVDSGAKQIFSHMTELSSGAASLYEYLEKIKNGAAELQNGTNRVATGAGSLSEGTQRLSSGLSQLSDSISGLPEGTGELLQGGKNLAVALKSGNANEPDQYGVYEAVQAIGKGAAQLGDALKAIMDGAETISDKCMEISAGAKSGSSNPGEYGIYEAAGALETGLENALANLESNLQQAAGALGTANESDQAAFEQLQNMAERLQNLQGFQELLTEMAANEQITAEAAQIIGGALNNAVNSAVSEESMTQILTEVGTSAAITGQVQSSLAEVSIDTTQMKTAISAIQNGAARISDGAAQLAVGAKSGRSADVSEYGIYEAAASAYAGTQQLSATALQICNAIDTMTNDSNLGALISGLEQLDAQGSELVSAIGQLSDGAETLFRGSEDLADGAVQTDAGAKTLADGTDRVLEGSKTLEEGAVQLAEGTKTLADGTNALVGGSSELMQGENTLKNGTGTLADGTQRLADGAKTLSAGADTLKNGMTELANGTTQLTDGSSKLEKGAAQLADGGKTLLAGIQKLDQEAISKIASLCGEDVQKVYRRLQAVLDYAQEPESFSGCADGIECNVQYVYKTGEIG